MKKIEEICKIDTSNLNPKLGKVVAEIQREALKTEPYLHYSAHNDSTREDYSEHRDVNTDREDWTCLHNDNYSEHRDGYTEHTDRNSI